MSSASEASEPETTLELSEKEKTTTEQCETEGTGPATAVLDEANKSDPDSDSTIEAARDETISPAEARTADQVSTLSRSLFTQTQNVRYTA